MYHIKVQSYDSDEPLYTKLRDGEGTLFVPEARVAKIISGLDSMREAILTGHSIISQRKIRNH